MSSAVRETPATRSGNVDSGGEQTAPTATKRPEPKVKSYPQLTPAGRYGFAADLSATAEIRTHVVAAPAPTKARFVSRDSTLLLAGVLALSLLVLGSGNLLRLLIQRSPEAQAS